jgi:hypothetical protein
VPAPHVAALSFFEQTPLLQTKPAAQSFTVEHIVWQALFVSQAYVPHDDGVAVWQVPVPLHVRACVNMPAVHVAVTQVVPAT